MARLQAARDRGRLGGRPPKLSADDLAVAERLLAAEFTAQAVAERLKVSRSTLFRALREAKEAKASEPDAAADTVKAFAAAVKRAVKGRSTSPLTGKVAIVEAYNIAARKQMDVGTLEEFKARLAGAAREGLLELERCDVAGVLPKELLSMSALRLGRDVRHLIVSDDF